MRRIPCVVGEGDGGNRHTEGRGEPGGWQWGRRREAEGIGRRDTENERLRESEIERRINRTGENRKENCKGQAENETEKGMKERKRGVCVWGGTDRMLA